MHRLPGNLNVTFPDVDGDALTVVLQQPPLHGDLILSAGGYKFTDFLRVGIPLTIIMWIGFSLLLPALYSL